MAKKYSADRFIKLSHEIKSCRWDEKRAKWDVSVKNLVTGNVIEDTCDVLISGRGNLNNPSWPDIAGLDTFKGEVMHSAKWNEKYDWTNKRIGVIGSGSSSIQIVPSLQRISGTNVTTFVRSKTWISPPFGQQLWEKHNFDGFKVPKDLQKKFHEDPEFYQKFRLEVDEDSNGVHGYTIKGTPIQMGAKQAFAEHMQKRLATHPHIYEALLPSFSPGCRRLTPGPGYLEALTQPNVNFVTSPITKISETAVHTKDGQTHTIDALVCATGFQTSAPPPFDLIGSNGLPITEKWRKRATNYMSHSISDFPNLFTMLGPNSAIGSGSLTMMIETVGDYIVKCIRKIQKENIASMVVKREREEDFTEYVDAYFVDTVFSEECNSWYKNKVPEREKDGEVVGLWPGSTLHCLEAMRSPRWEDFEYRYIGDDADEGVNGKKRKRVNQLAFLGNGWTTQLLEQRDLAWYLYPEFQDKPCAPLPEEKSSLKIRKFSY